jgi:hypothetical protein
MCYFFMLLTAVDRAFANGDLNRLMGQDGIYLQVIATSGEGKEQRHAQRVYQLLKRGKHWVLVTLLLSNVIVNETLPIVLDRSLGGGWPAVLGSTVLIGMYNFKLSIILPRSCTDFSSDLRRDNSSVSMRSIWLANRRVHGAVCADTYVPPCSYCVAYCKASR